MIVCLLCGALVVFMLLGFVDRLLGLLGREGGWLVGLFEFARLVACLCGAR